MKKILFVITFFLAFMFVTDVYAADASITIKTNKSTYLVGDTVTTTITLSANQALGSWDFTISYDSSYLQFLSSTLEGSDQAVNTVSNSTTKSKTYTMKFKAKKSGSPKIGVKSGLVVYGYNENLLSVSTGTKTLKVITQADYENSLSKDNTLKSLEVEGYTLNPTFDKNTTNYSLTVPNDVRSINVVATKNDSKASVHGGGVVNLEEGLNKISIEVEAQNGNSKTYVINVTVAELDPIEVMVDGNKYKVVRKKDNLEAPTNYTDTTTMIDGVEVPSFESDITGYTLVGLTDEEGNINLYIYENNNYILYQENKFNGLTLYFEKPNDITFSDYEEKVIQIGDEDITSYIVKGMEFPLVYGMNVETGKSDWYSYDANENTLQKAILNSLNETVDKKYQALSLILGIISGILFIFMIILTIKQNKLSKSIPNKA